ncbi:MAG: hypothetical protein ACI9WO_001330, partial [Sphingobacteriales bacterium]
KQTNPSWVARKGCFCKSINLKKGDFHGDRINFELMKLRERMIIS